MALIVAIICLVIAAIIVGTVIEIVKCNTLGG